MAYTKAHRKAIAEIFTKAHDRMEKNPLWGVKSQRFICVNLGMEDPKLWQVRAAIAIVTERILWRVSLEFWLEQNGHITEEFRRTAMRADRDSFERRQIHQYRLRWLKELIREFST